MPLILYNTLKRQKEPFIPLDPKNVRLYVCGPTVYDFAHIGNARPYVIFDVLNRLLRSVYERVTYVRNITDIDDKIINASQANGEEIYDLTQRTTRHFQQDMEAIGNLAPNVEPLATAHVNEMISLIKCLLEKGHAYENERHVLFSVKSFPSYGQLSRCNHDEMIAGARVEVAPYKREPEDFILWKPSEKGIPGWESPWGLGRPGWHIECSAMSLKYLGETFDIHGGGQDLIFPHHENEVAQSQACFGPDTFARMWLHNGMLTVNGEKMSKSLGNFITIHQLLEKLPGELVRFVLLSSHYRQPLDWNDQVVHQSRQSLDRLYNALRGRKMSEKSDVFEPIKTALEDDLNTPLAISALHELATQIHKTSSEDEKNQLASTLKASGAWLGLLQQDPESWFKGKTGIDEAAILALIEARNQARQQKNFIEADRVRHELLKAGILLEDGPQGTIWRQQSD
ncbi:MAG TPA: cysteine--tRNA ligase [Alphaproteobacteria bacterium]|nr:cysteine--tRNA ligase [Alphaproteobacteria bacterium]